VPFSGLIKIFLTISTIFRKNRENCLYLQW